MGTAAGQSAVGIAEDDGNAVHRDLQCRRDDLRKTRLVPLARGLGADHRLDAPIRQDADVGPLHRRAGGRFEIGHDADPGA